VDTRVVAAGATKVAVVGTGRTKRKTDEEMLTA
jgi:hypothetical protein